MKRWIAIAALLIAAQAAAQTTPNQVYDGTRWKPRTGTTAGSGHVHVTNQPTVTNDVPNAMGPTTHRENNGGAPWVASYVRDSTAAIPLYGGKRALVRIFAVVDTAAADSLGVIHWYALGVRSSTAAANDTGVTSPILPIQAPATIGGLSNVIAAFPHNSPLSGTGLVTSVNVATNLLPGEILVPVQTNANGVPGSRSVIVEVGGEAAVFTLRSFGHWVLNPQASFIRLPIYKTRVRVDVTVTQ